jgi:hypothetical protein
LRRILDYLSPRCGEQRQIAVKCVELVSTEHILTTVREIAILQSMAGCPQVCVRARGPPHAAAVARLTPRPPAGRSRG